MYLKRIYNFFTFYILISLFYCILYIFLLEKNNLNGQYWIKNVEYVKDKIIYQFKNEKRILIFSGSNGMFGFNSLLIEENFAKKTVNMAFNAGVPFSYIVHKIKKNAKEGDIVLLPLEYIHYFREDHNTNSILDMFTWNKKYFYELNIVEKAKIMFAYTNNKILLDAVLSNFENNTIPKGVLREKEISKIEVLKRFKNNTLNNTILYRFDTLNERGDVTNNIDAQRKMKNKKDAYYNIGLPISTSFIKGNEELQEYALKNNIKIHYLYPSTLKNENYDLEKLRDIKKVNKLNSKLKEYNIILLGNPKKYNFESKYMFNTSYHLTREGANLRTKYVIEDLFTEFKINHDKMDLK